MGRAALWLPETERLLDFTLNDKAGGVTLLKFIQL